MGNSTTGFCHLMNDETNDNFNYTVRTENSYIILKDRVTGETFTYKLVEVEE